MKSFLLYGVNLIFGLMPLTRWYKIRAILLRLCGVNCSKSARIISSARIVFSNVKIGADTFVGHQVLITGNPEYVINIGNCVDIAPRVVIISGSHQVDMVNMHSAGQGSGGAVTIDDGVWIGANTTILPGVSIGKKAIIGAGSVVVKNIPPYCIAVGNPCKPIKQWDIKSSSFKELPK